MSSAKIKEIFESIQGEGPYIGYKQLFIRFCGCNLACKYCDTDYSAVSDYEEYDADSLIKIVNAHENIHSVSLTGGEPLLQTRFLKEFLPSVNKKIYLETNATLYNELLEIKPYIDIISADIKLYSATGMKDLSDEHRKFFENCSGVETFAKIVFNEKITDEEIKMCSELGLDYNIELILQPEMNSDFVTITPEFVSGILDKFLVYNKRVRLIPQTHKFLNVR